MRVARPRTHRALCSLVAASVVSWSLPAGAVDKAACVDAAEAGQRLRKEGRLISARDSLLVCASPECPAIVSQDCTGWLGEVQRRLASVVVRARDAHGEVLSDVVVSLDGATLTERAPTAPIDLDPGDHVFRCERAGFEVAQQRARLAEGERAREVVCEMKALASTAPAAALTETPAPIERPSPMTPHPATIPWTVWALGGLGVAGLGSFTVFGLLGRNDENNDARPKPFGCKPDCSPSQVDAIRTKYIVADVSLAVGLVALGAAALIGVIHASAPAPQTSGQVSSGANRGREAQFPPLRQNPVEEPASLIMQKPQHWPVGPVMQGAPAARHGMQVLFEPQ